MRVKDEQLWSLQLAEFEADEMGQKFREFLVTWADTADRLAADSPATRLSDAVSKAFEETEEIFGFISVEWLGQMLLVIIQHWISGEELWESLSVWERRMVEQATALKIAELQDQAAQRADDTGSDTPEHGLD
jgi:hypothetical protein